MDNLMVAEIRHGLTQTPTFLGIWRPLGLFLLIVYLWSIAIGFQQAMYWLPIVPIALTIAGRNYQKQDPEIYPIIIDFVKLPREVYA